MKPNSPELPTFLFPLISSFYNAFYSSQKASVSKKSETTCPFERTVAPLFFDTLMLKK